MTTAEFETAKERTLCELMPKFKSGDYGTRKSASAQWKTFLDDARARVKRAREMSDAKPLTPQQEIEAQLARNQEDFLPGQFSHEPNERTKARDERLRLDREALGATSQQPNAEHVAVIKSLKFDSNFTSRLLDKNAIGHAEAVEAWNRAHELAYGTEPAEPVTNA